jgi:hypothetical protein
MTISEAIKKANEKQAAAAQQAPTPGPAPATKAEADAMRQQQAAVEDEVFQNQMRVQALSGSIYARLLGTSTILDDAVTITPTDGGNQVSIDQQFLNSFLAAANVVAATAAASHAKNVWGIQFVGQSANGEKAPAQPDNAVVPLQQVPAQSAA